MYCPVLPCTADLDLPMDDLENAWLAAIKQMAMALPPDHAMFETALRELGRWVGWGGGGGGVGDRRRR